MRSLYAVAFIALALIATLQPVSADTMILYPNEDRQFTRELDPSTFTSLATGAGLANSLLATCGIAVVGSATTNNYTLLRAYGATFNTTILTANSTVTNASLTLAYNAKYNFQGTPSLVITRFKPANYYSIADTANYPRFINTSIGSISYASYASGNNTIYLSDLTAVNKTGITALGARLNWHVDQGATSPTWASGGAPSGFYIYTTAQAGIGQDPFLTIVFTAADVAPPDSLSSFANTTNCSQTNISFTKPADSDYDGFKVWWNNAAETNQTNASTWYNKSGLFASTEYTLSTKTFDLVGNLNATFTNYTVTTTACGDTTPPDSITNLHNTSINCSQIDVAWTNPTDADFNGTELFLNNAFVHNTSKAATTASAGSLAESTAYTFSFRTFDEVGNVNSTWVNITETTTACGVAPTAAFSADDTTVCTVDTVTFTDASINSPTTWNWSFGDGNVSALQNPTKIFNITGTYTINLTVNNTYGSDSEVKTNYIVVSECAVPTPAPTVAEDWEACFPWCGIQEIFFWNASSDVSGYKILDHMPEKSVQREVNVTVSAATGSLQLGAWVSPAGTPGVTTIAPGMWRFRTYHNVSSQVGITTLEFHIVNRSSTGVETDLFYGNAITKDINTLDPAEQLLSYARRNVTTMFDGDRLVIKVNATTTSVTARTVYMWLGGNTNTSMVQAGNFICCEGGGCNTGSEGIAILFGVVGGILGAIAILRRRGEAP